MLELARVSEGPSINDVRTGGGGNQSIDRLRVRESVKVTGRGQEIPRLCRGDSWMVSEIMRLILPD